jgi:type III secretory pathway lipoprotein EscJ
VCACLSAACDVTFARHLSQHEADELRTQLNRRGIAANLATDSDGMRLELAETSVAPAVAALCSQAAQTSQNAATSLTVSSASRAETALLPTRAAESRVRAERIERHVKERIEQLPGVERASVLVTLPPSPNRLHDLLETAVSARPSVAISLVRSATSPATLAAQVRAAVTSALPETPSSHLELTVHEQVAQNAGEVCTPLAHIGAITVTSDSIVTLKAWLAGSLVLHMLGAGVLLLMLQRRQRRDRPAR